MRPTLLTPLFADISTLSGVGEKTAISLSKLLGFQEANESARLIDLLFHLPRSIINRGYRPNIAEAKVGIIATMEVKVLEHIAPPPNTRVPYKVKVEDASGKMVLSFFRAGDWLAKQLPLGEVRYISGRVDEYKGEKTMTHPDYILTKDSLNTLPTIEPIYKLNSGVTQKIMLKSVADALAKLKKICEDKTFGEWNNEPLMKQQQWLSFYETLHRLHNPQSEDDILSGSIYRRRLAFDELLSRQLAFALVRAKMLRAGGHRWQGDGTKAQIIKDNLPFELTKSQLRSIKEIYSDLSGERRMMRLLQGDVGSGKTIVALFAACNVIESGGQVAMMAPTEILARQHYETIMGYGEKSGLRVALLTGKDKGKARQDILEKLEQGGVDLLVGTHAIFQEGVVFKNLGLAVVDEQHRFGVHQRLALASKGKADILLMTATPIPRTLVLSHYGNMGVSKLNELPKGRGEIKTHIISKTKIENLMVRIKQAVAEGNQAYWVCPLVEDSEKLNFTSVQTRFASLQEMLGEKVALLHGKMKVGEKEEVMEKFRKGKIKLLVATTVIEVGVDVSDVKIMVIEHAERFGLSQLHQLRGRIGRGQKHGESYCMLLYQSPLGDVARERLEIMRQSQNGFVIAEKDLQLRGAGDLLGTRQSGSEDYELSDLPEQFDLLRMARHQAKLIIRLDEDLQASNGEALKILLYLFSRDEAVRLLRAG